MSRGPFRLHPVDLLFPVVSLVLIATVWSGLGVRTPFIMGLLVAGVVVSGLPHGSLDPLVARKLFAGNRRFTMARFLVSYVLLAAVCAAGWLAAPNFALCVFLIVSALHFGSDWEGRAEVWAQAAYGFCVISISTLRYAPDVRQIFTVLGATAASGIVIGLRDLAGFAILIAAISQLRRAPSRSLDRMEFAMILLGGLALPPLLFFFCYFCMLHSPRHLLLTSRQVALRGAVRVFTAAAPAVLGTLALAAFLWRFLPVSNVSNRVLQIVFIGLAALTAPHMLLTALNDRERLRLDRTSVKEALSNGKCIFTQPHSPGGSDFNTEVDRSGTINQMGTPS
jgi:Brp/Blh family beta-carotene 15,15'-monooxygenase